MQIIYLVFHPLFFAFCTTPIILWSSCYEITRITSNHHPNYHDQSPINDNFSFFPPLMSTTIITTTSTTSTTTSTTITTTVISVFNSRLKRLNKIPPPPLHSQSSFLSLPAFHSFFSFPFPFHFNFHHHYYHLFFVIVFFVVVVVLLLFFIYFLLLLLDELTIT